MRRINELGGKEFDYTKEDTPRQLLFDYVMYGREKALDDFFNNYKSEIIGLQLREEADRAKKEDGDI